MNRIATTVLLLLAACVTLPTIADAADRAVPALVSLLILVGAVKLGLPISRKRHRS